MFTEHELRRPERRRLVSAPGLALWVVLAAWLGFGAFAKLTSPNPHDRFFDLTQAWLEVGVIVAVLLGHSWRVTWLCVSMMFAGFAGWGLYAQVHQVSCGCFGSLWTPPAWVSMSVAVVFVGAGLAMARNRAATRDMIIVAGVAAVIAGAAGYFAYDVKKTGEELRRAESTIAANEADIASLRAAVSSGVAMESGGEVPAVDPCVLKYDNSPIGRVMKLEENRDICRSGPGDPVWVILIHDEYCHVCEQSKYAWDPMMDDLASSGDLVMQVRQFEINELEAEHGIEAWNWEQTPNFFVIRNGEILGEEWRWQGEDWPMPETVRERIQEAFFGG